MILIFNKFQLIKLSNPAFRDEMAKLQTSVIGKFVNIDISEDLLDWYLLLSKQCFDKNKFEYLDKFMLEIPPYLRKTLKNKSIIYKSINGILNEPDLYINNKVELVELYRRIVSDLLDPYLSVIYSMYLFLEGSFTSIDDSNILLGERQKYEYIMKRSPESYQSIGYDPIIRNAISHTGTDGVKYYEDKIIFKNIRRGSSPKIEPKVVDVTTLVLKINLMVDFIHSIDLGFRIFNMDCREEIIINHKLANKLITYTLNKDKRRAFQNTTDNMLKKITEDEELDFDQKFEELSNLALQNMPTLSDSIISIKHEIHAMPLVVVRIKAQKFDPENSNQFVGRILYCAQYGLMISVIYQHLFTHFVILEEDDQSNEKLALVCEIEPYLKHHREETPIYKVMSSLTIYYENRLVNFQVDEEAALMKTLEMGHLTDDDIFYDS